jgi:hypothetical protein
VNVVKTAARMVLGERLQALERKSATQLQQIRISLTTLATDSRSSQECHTS